MFMISGWNDFYEGWLARVLEQPKDSDSSYFSAGWDRANEYPQAQRLSALADEIRIGQEGGILRIIVEKVKMK